jgi:hypothetical protein
MQGCQMVYFHTKNPNLSVFGMENVDIFCGPLEYCTAIRYMLRHIGIFCGILVFFSCFGMFTRKKSGNPDAL